MTGTTNEDLENEELAYPVNIETLEGWEEFKPAQEGETTPLTGFQRTDDNVDFIVIFREEDGYSYEYRGEFDGFSRDVQTADAVKEIVKGLMKQAELSYNCIMPRNKPLPVTPETVHEEVGDGWVRTGVTPMHKVTYLTPVEYNAEKDELRLVGDENVEEDFRPTINETFGGHNTKEELKEDLRNDLLSNIVNSDADVATAAYQEMLKMADEKFVIAQMKLADETSMGFEGFIVDHMDMEWSVDNARRIAQASLSDLIENYDEYEIDTIREENPEYEERLTKMKSLL